MNKTKKLLIDITFNHLYKRGYCATGLMDILKTAKLTKGAMYYHFENKNDLVLGTMEYYLEAILKSQWIEPFKNSNKPVESLIKQINAYANMFEDEESFLDIKHGCPLSNFVLDMSDKDEKFFDYLQSVYYRWEKSIEKVLLQAIELKQTKTDFNSEDEAIFIISAIEGSIATAKAYNSLDSLKRSFNILTVYLQKL
jgi:TetR/AcrR family transcriptional regulator, transcriptional repressor for nem operon